MKAIVKRIYIIFISLVILTQTGCWDQKIYERIGFMLQLGLEVDQDDKILYTVSVPVVDTDAEGNVEILSTKGNLLRESRENIRHFSGKAVEGGKIQHIYFSNDLAQRGIGEFLEIFMRNTENPVLANIIVVEGSPKELMETSSKYKDKPRPAFYVNDLLVDARQSAYTPETRVYDFMIKKYSESIDPITPIIRFDENVIEIIGTALFHGDRMVGNIDTDKTGLLLAMMNVKKNVSYIYSKPLKRDKQEGRKSGAAILIRDSGRKINIDFVEGKPLINIKLDMSASLEEYDEEHKLDDPGVEKEIEELIALSIQEDCKEILKYLQEIGSDPLGIGEMLRAKHNKYWKSVEWQEVYKGITFDVNIDLNIQIYGAIS